MADRRAGQYARSAVHRLARRVLLAVCALALVTAIAGLLLGSDSTAFVAVELTAVAALSALDRLTSSAIDRWDRGAVGEEEVGELLTELEPDGWRFLHDVATGRGNVDHIVVGPGGLFTIETKSHPGRISALDIDPRMLKQAYAEAKFVERITGHRVEPLLVLSRAWVDPGVSRQRGVTVLSGRLLPGHLNRRPARLTPADIDQIHAGLVSALSVGHPTVAWT